MTSTLPRAFETAIAMGFAVDEQIELISTYGNDVGREAPWPLSLAGYAEVVTKGGAAARYANQLLEVYGKLINYLADGRTALVINHGGILELGAVACLMQIIFRGVHTLTTVKACVCFGRRVNG